MSLGAWQSFPVPFSGDETFQIAMLDYELGESQRTNGTVNGRFAEQCGYSTATMTTQSAPQACIAFVLDESGSIATTAFDRVRLSVKARGKEEMQAMQELSAYVDNGAYDEYAVDISVATARFMIRRLRQVHESSTALLLTASGHLVRR